MYCAYLRRDLQRHLLAAAGDPQRRAAVLQRLRRDDGTVDVIVLAVERDSSVAPGVAHDLDALVEPAQPDACRREAVPVGLPLVLVPAAADTHLDPPAGDDVGGGGHLRQIDRVAIAHRRAHLAELDARRGGGVGRHQRPRLVGGLVRRHRHGVEVVVHPQRVPRAVVGVGGQLTHHRPVFFGGNVNEIESPALRDEESKAHTLALYDRD